MDKKQIAKQRIKILFQQAKKTPKYANKYIKLAIKLAQKARTRIPKIYKRKFCKHCKNYFTKNNYRVRTIKHKLVYTCKKCKKFTRIPLKPSTKLKASQQQHDEKN